MRRSILVLATLALPLGACAGIGGGDPDLYGKLAQQDVELAARLMQSTLETAPDGATRRWTNDTTGNGGTITPTRTYVSDDGHFCRDYREEIAAGIEQGRFFHTACRSENARWIWL
jgi:surface antigen